MSAALASRAAHAFIASEGERTSLKRPRGAVAVAPVACGKMGQEKFARRIVASTKPSAPPAEKRARSVREVPVVLPAPPRQLKEQMEDASAGKDGAPILDAKRRRPEATSAEEAAKRRKSSSSTPAAQAAHQRTEPAAKQQPLPDQHRAARTAAQSPISKLIEKGKAALKRRRLEEIARAREKFRRELLEVEKAAMPDETIYPEDLEELGLTELQYAVTRTRKQALRTGCGVTGGGLHVAGP